MKEVTSEQHTMSVAHQWHRIRQHAPTTDSCTADTCRYVVVVAGNKHTTYASDALTATFANETTLADTRSGGPPTLATVMGEAQVSAELTIRSVSPTETPTPVMLTTVGVLIIITAGLNPEGATEKKEHKNPDCRAIAKDTKKKKERNKDSHEIESV